MTTKVTISDIARLAGVSKATVSRVLNQKPDVDPATRERVERIMGEYGFVPNLAASGLAGGRPRLLGVLVPSVTWPLMPEIMRGIGEVVEQTAYEVVLYTMSPNVDRSSVIDQILAAKLTAGLLAIFPGQSSEHLMTLHEQGVPVVLIDDQNPVPNAPWVGTDNRAGAREAVQHLIARGHTRIGHIRGIASHQVSYDRHEGYREALEAAGLPVDPELVTQGDFTPPSGRVCGGRLLSLPHPPTAIFAANDEMAYGVYAAAEEGGRRIPDDLSVVGFDDISSSAHIRPALTTVRQPFYEMGQQATRLLLSLVEAVHGGGPVRRVAGQGAAGNGLLAVPGSTQTPPVRIELPSLFVPRDSCAAPATIGASWTRA